MHRAKELLWTLGFNILLPRFCWLVLLPGLLVVPTPPHSPPLPWGYQGLPPSWAAGVIAACVLVFGVSVAANLSVSRYLRLRETPDSPYAYAYWYGMSRRSYFRIQVTDPVEFRRLLEGLRWDKPRAVIGRWLVIDDLIYAPPVVFALAVLVLVVFLLWLVKILFYKITGRKPHPASWS